MKRSPFSTRKETLPPVGIHNRDYVQSENMKYFEIHLDRKPTWRNIFTKRKQLGLKLSQMYWIIGRKSQQNKI